MRTYSGWGEAYECLLDCNLVVADTFSLSGGIIQLMLGDDVVATASESATFIRICKFVDTVEAKN